MLENPNCGWLGAVEGFGFRLYRSTFTDIPGSSSGTRRIQVVPNSCADTQLCQYVSAGTWCVDMDVPVYS